MGIGESGGDFDRIGGKGWANRSVEESSYWFHGGGGGRGCLSKRGKVEGLKIAQSGLGKG